MTSPAGGRPPLLPLADHPQVGTDEHPIADLFDQWLTARSARNRIGSERTLTAYWTEMRRWALLLTAATPDTAWTVFRLDHLTEPAIERALSAMTTAGFSVAARARAIAPLRGFCEWLTARDHLHRDPTVELDITTRADRSSVATKTFTDVDLAKLRTAAERPTRPNCWPARDVAAFALLAGCGLRASELVDARVSWVQDLAGDDPRIVVRGKGAKYRVVPLSPAVVDDLAEFLFDRALRSETTTGLRIVDSAPLIVRDNGAAITSAVLDSMIGRWARQAEVRLPQQARAHAFRHTFAVELTAAGVPLPHLQALLGHASPATTGVYAKARPQDLRVAVRAVPTGR